MGKTRLDKGWINFFSMFFSHLLLSSGSSRMGCIMVPFSAFALRISPAIKTKKSRKMLEQGKCHFLHPLFLLDVGLKASARKSTICRKLQKKSCVSESLQNRNRRSLNWRVTASFEKLQVGGGFRGDHSSGKAARAVLQGLYWTIKHESSRVLMGFIESPLYCPSLLW